MPIAYIVPNENYNVQEIEDLCKKKGLLVSTLRKHKGCPVPSPKDVIGKGGFRAKNKDHEKKPKRRYRRKV
jgi:hypothetical protein